MSDESEALENLALDISSLEGGGGAAKDRVARVYVQLASSYLAGQGAPTLTRDCQSIEELEAEITRLKHECDTILGEARSQLGRALEASSAVPAAEASAEAHADSPKTALQVSNELRVSDRMSPDVRVMRRNDKLSVAQELMKVGGFRHVLVLEDSDDRLAGVVSHRDIFYSALSWVTGRGERMHETSLNQIPAKEVMTNNPRTVSPGTSLREAAKILLKEKIGCLPVIEEERVVGILTEGDFLSLIASALPSD